MGATWNEASGATSWEVAGARGDQDVGNVVLGELAGAQAGSVETQLNEAGVAAVQTWIDDPSRNFGFAIHNFDKASDACEVSSSDKTRTADRPKITITYLDCNASGEPGSDGESAASGDTDGTPQESSETPDDSGDSLTSVSFRDGENGYDGTEDTKLNCAKPEKDYGGSKRLDLDGSPCESVLMRWDLLGVPTGATVDAVTLTLDVVNPSRDAFQIYAVNRDWSESEATWQAASGVGDWETPGVNGVQDRGSTVLGEVKANETGVVDIHLNQAGVATVQSWINGASQNYGFAIQNYGTAKDALEFSSSDQRDVSARPKLTIAYT
jgi:hypothetical protein